MERVIELRLDAGDSIQTLSDDIIGVGQTIEETFQGIVLDIDSSSLTQLSNEAETVADAVSASFSDISSEIGPLEFNLPQSDEFATVQGEIQELFDISNAAQSEFNNAFINSSTEGLAAFRANAQEFIEAIDTSAASFSGLDGIVDSQRSRVEGLRDAAIQARNEIETQQEIDINTAELEAELNRIADAVRVSPEIDFDGIGDRIDELTEFEDRFRVDLELEFNPDVNSEEARDAALADLDNLVAEIQDFSFDAEFQIIDVQEELDSLNQLADGLNAELDGLTQDQIDLGVADSINEDLQSIGLLGERLETELRSLETSAANADIQLGIAEEIEAEINSIEFETTFDRFRQGFGDAAVTAAGVAATAFEVLPDSIRGRLADAIGSGVREGASGIGGILSGAFDSVRGLASRAFGGIGSAISGQISGAFGGIDGIIGGIFNGLLQNPAIAGAFEGLQTLFNDTLGRIADAIAPLIENVLPVITDIIGTVADVLTPVISTIADAFASIDFGPIADAIGAIVGVVGQLFSSIDIGAIFGVLADLVNTILPPLADLFGLVFGVIGDFIASSGPIFQELFTAVVEIFATLFEALQPLLPVLGELLVTALSAALPIVTALVPVITLFAEILADLAPILVPLIEIALIPLTALLGLLTGDLDSTSESTEGLSVAFEIMGAIIDVVVNGIFGTVISIFSGIAGFIIGIGSRIVGAVRSAWGLVESFIINPIRNARDTVSNAVDRIAEFLNFGGLADSVRNTFDSLFDFITSPIRRAREFIEEQAQRIRDSIDGIPLVGGFLGGAVDAAFAGGGLMIDGIPFYANGGVDRVDSAGGRVTRRPSYVTSEFGHTEVIIPEVAGMGRVMDLLGQTNILGRLRDEFDRTRLVPALNAMSSVPSGVGGPVTNNNITMPTTINVSNDGRRSAGELRLQARRQRSLAIEAVRANFDRL